MPAYTRGQLRNVLTFVKVTEPNLYFGWNAKDITGLPGISNADLVALGHITPAAIIGNNAAIAILGANRPKPPRATKILNANPDNNTQGRASTYLGIGSEGTALANGWKMTGNRKGVNIKQTGRTVTVAVQLSNGGYYAFPMNSGDVGVYAEELGLKLPAQITGAERSKIFSGATRPKPPRVQKKLANGRVNSFCDPSKLDDLLAAGWSELESEVKLVFAPVPEE